MQPIEMRPIGEVRSPFTSPEGAPIQPGGAAGVRGRIVILPEYQAGLQDLAGFSHIHLLYYFHLARPFSLAVTPFLDTVERGLFATRAPARPNAIGISVVRLICVSGNVLEVEDVDVVDRTPLLDIKPYVPDFDARPAERIGWMSATARNVGAVTADGRFTRKGPGNG